MRLRMIALAGALLMIFGATACFATPAATGRLWDTSLNPDAHREPEPEEDLCDVEETGVYEITTSGTEMSPNIVEGVCVTHGAIVINADHVVLRSSYVQGYPVDNSDNESPACDPADEPMNPDYCTSYFQAVVVVGDHEGVLIHENDIDCGGAVTIWPDAASHGITGHNVHANNNHISNCTDGIILGENSYYGYNLIDLPDNCDNTTPTPPDPTWCDLHADGVQFSTLDNGDPIGNTMFEWNNIRFPQASSAFQFHGSTDPDEGPYNIVLRYNSLWGGAVVLRLPRYDNGGLEVYGNWLKNLHVSEFGLCTSFVENGADVIDVWGGTEAGVTGDWDEDGVILDGDNVAEAESPPHAVLERTDCE